MTIFSVANSSIFNLSKDENVHTYATTQLKKERIYVINWEYQRSNWHPDDFPLGIQISKSKFIAKYNHSHSYWFVYFKPIGMWICMPRPQNWKKKEFAIYSQSIKQAIGIQVILIFEIKLQNYTF